MSRPFAGQSPNPVEKQTLHLSEIISALSFALDLTEGAVAGHGVRTCLLGMRIGERAGLSQTDLHELYYALLLKDIGCSSNAAHVPDRRRR
jgi:HD-GYP domain-containing protein (c-di-GMP phosphodiesterase class II)